MNNLCTYFLLRHMAGGPGGGGGWTWHFSIIN
jgi:hypothetical protein